MAYLASQNTQHDERLCPKYERAVQIISKRWTPLIIRVLLDRPRRFSEINEVVQRLSDRVLSERLKELEDEGIVERHVYPETPVRIMYSLTPKGHDLERALNEIQRWSDTWMTMDVPDAPHEPAE